MHHRDGIRPRPIDDSKQNLIIKDLAEAKNNATDKDQENKINDIEKDLYKIIEYFDKKKKNQIPKAKIINEKNDKNENNVNYSVNNNIIYTIEKSNDPNQNNSQYILNCKLTEFRRPESYIIYSSSLQDKLNSQRKIYEATEADKYFLTIRQNFMSLEELENIMTDLENNCTNEKDDKINEESARNIIEKKYSKYLNYIDSIINHFKDRRMSIKKSLIRKKWHKNKSTDKFLTNTFKRRASDKRQTRKNNQNKGESLEKIKEAKKFCEDYLSLLMNDMSIKETSKKNLLKIEEFIFLSEINKFKKENIPDARIKENKSILKEIEKNNKKNEENIPKSTNNQKNISRNPNDSSIASSQNRIKNNINTNIAQISQNGNNNDNSQINNININDQRRIHPQSPENANINNTKKTNNNKNQTRNKNDIFPDVSLNCLLNNNNSINLNEENYNENNNKKKNSVRMRIRINRNNQIVIDRYIQNNNDFDPFNDSYNEVFANYRKYDINELEYLTNNNFEKLYNSFNLNKLNELNIFCDSEDEDTNGDIKQFSNSYKQFLKSKRALEK
jgi:hypothetical protein